MYPGKIRNSGQIADKPKFSQKEKPTKGFVKPNVSCAYGDPHGIEKSPVALCILSKNQKNRIIESFATHLKKRTFSNFLRFFVTIKNKQRTTYGVSLRIIAADFIRGRRLAYFYSSYSYYSIFV